MLRWMYKLTRNNKMSGTGFPKFHGEMTEVVQACDEDRRRILGTSVRGVAIGVNVCESKGMDRVCVCVTLPFPAEGMGAL